MRRDYNARARERKPFLRREEKAPAVDESGLTICFSSAFRWLSTP
jgi:hypothetical protein